MNNIEATRLISDFVKVVGLKAAQELLKPPFTVNVSEHPTGIYVSIWAQHGYHPAICVWRGAIWSPGALASDDRHTFLGLQPECRFAAGPVFDFIERVKQRTEEIAAEKEARRLAEQRSLAEKRKDALEFYARMVKDQ